MAADPITKSTVDDLLDFDFSDGDDPFAEKPLNKTRDDKATLSPRAGKRKLDDDKENLGLGLDEEVKIVKKRKPTVKLDEARLLSENGIPRLRALARSGKVAKKLGFKGKGHEFSDVARLLNYYQLWLDGLFPRAKFADGLQLIEKVGHSKRMTVMRKEWIDEGKPGYIGRYSNIDNNEEIIRTDSMPPQGSTSGNEPHPDNLFFSDNTAKKPENEVDGPEDDELDALMAEHEHPAEAPVRRIQVDSEGEDDLAALLAEHHAEVLTEAHLHQPMSGPGGDDDDMDALLAEQEFHRNKPLDPLPQESKSMLDQDNEQDEKDDLAALMAEQEADQHNAVLENSEENAPEDQEPVEAEAELGVDVPPSSPLPNNPEDEDDLDAIFAEHEASR